MGLPKILPRPYCFSPRPRISSRDKSWLSMEALACDDPQQFVTEHQFLYRAQFVMKPLWPIVLLFAAVFAHAQARPEDGGHELQLWSGGGHSVSGGTSN